MSDRKDNSPQARARRLKELEFERKRDAILARIAKLGEMRTARGATHWEETTAVEKLVVAREQLRQLYRQYGRFPEKAKPPKKAKPPEKAKPPRVDPVAAFHAHSLKRTGKRGKYTPQHVWRPPKTRHRSTGRPRRNKPTVTVAPISS
jgi:hypothetical protein